MLLARPSFAAPSLWVPLLLLSLGCASREVPARFPQSSAASPEAPAGVSLTVTQALASEPPLPGLEQQGWQGLDEATPSAGDAGAVDPHAAHRGHHGH
jgi:hypothetical protein